MQIGLSRFGFFSMLCYGDRTVSRDWQTNTSRLEWECRGVETAVWDKQMRWEEIAGE